MISLPSSAPLNSRGTPNAYLLTTKLAVQSSSSVTLAIANFGRNLPKISRSIPRASLLMIATGSFPPSSRNGVNSGNSYLRRLLKSTPGIFSASAKASGSGLNSSTTHAASGMSSSSTPTPTQRLMTSTSSIALLVIVQLPSSSSYLT